MGLFLLKLTLTPAMMYAVTAAGRRWGPGVSGWLTGLPLLAGPISVFVCIEQGPAFAARAAGTTILGLWSSCGFFFAYTFAVRRGLTWPVASAVAILTFLAATAVLGRVPAGPWIAFAGVAAGAWACLRAVRTPRSPPAVPRPWRWDMPARMLIAATFVVVQTAAAGWLGPQLSGLMTPFPIVVILLTAFAHHQLGADGAIRVLRGFVIGMYAFASFFLVVALTLGHLGPLSTYPLALAVGVAINGATLASLRRRGL